MKKSHFIVHSQFEAARRFILNPNRPQADYPAHLARLHGHSFQASIRSSTPLNASPPLSSLGESTPLVQSNEQWLQSTLEPLNYQYLNEVLPCTPFDSTIAAWLFTQIPSSTTLSSEIKSTGSQGVKIFLNQKNHSNQATLRIWRRYRFEAAHQLLNVPLTHKCAKMHGHGFEILIATDHSLDAVSDLLCTPFNEHLVYEKIDKAWFPIHALMHHACINHLAGLENPTSEVMCQWVWERLKKTLAPLSQVQILETPSSGAAYNGTTYSTWKEFTFDSAVNLSSKDSKAALTKNTSEFLGHTYSLQVKLTSEHLQHEGWIWDFGDIKTAFAPILRAIDHQIVNDVNGVKSGDLEDIGHWFHSHASVEIPALDSITLFETPAYGIHIGPNID